MSGISVKVRRIGAITMAAALIIGQFPISAVAASRGGAARGVDDSTLITAFATIPENVASQKLTVGAKESDISFPSSLTATVLVNSSTGDDTSSAGTENGSEDNKETVTDDPTTGGSDDQSGAAEQGGQNAPEESPATEPSQEGSPSENGSGTESGSQTNDNASESESGSSTGAEQTDAPGEGGSDSASIKSIIDYFDLYNIPKTVHAAEDTTNTQETKDAVIEGITWTINPEKSSASIFSSDKAGNYFEYTAVLPASYKTEAQLPTIKVTIVKDEVKPERKEFGSVEYIGEDKEKATIDDYASVHSSDKKVEWKDDWYVLGSNAEISGEIFICGKVNLILTDGHTLKLTKSHITADKGSVLKIFGQENGTGALTIRFEKESSQDEKDTKNDKNTQIATDSKPAISLDGSDMIIFGGTVDLDAADNTAVSAETVTINGGFVSVKGKTGIYTKSAFTVSGGKTVVSSIGSETDANGELILGLTDKEDSFKIEESVFLAESKAVQIADKVILGDGKDVYRGKYTASSTPSYKVFEGKTLTAAVLEETPIITFNANGVSSAKLSNLKAGDKYILQGAGLTETEITASSKGAYSISKGLKEGELQIVKAGKDGTYNSDPQLLTITKAEDPSGIKAKACISVTNDDGMITGLDTGKRYEYRSQDAKSYTAVASGTSSISDLKSGTYLIRIRPNGTMLASRSLSLKIAPAVLGKVETPSISPKGGSYTSSQQVSISTKTEDATIYYTTDGTTPTTSSRKYTGPIEVSSSKTIKAFAVKDGMTNSSVSSATFTIQTVKKSTTTGSSLLKGTTTKKTGTTAKSGTSTTKSGSSTKSGTAATKSSSSKSSSSKSSASKSATSGTGSTITKKSSADTYSSKSRSSSRTKSSSSDDLMQGVDNDFEQDLDYYDAMGLEDPADFLHSGSADTTIVDSEATGAESGIYSQDSGVLLADAAVDEDSEEDLAGVYDFDPEMMASSLNGSLLIIALAGILGLGAVVAVCIRNKKRNSI
jgi:hypothetical protein